MSDLTVVLRTNDEEKDDDTGVRVAIDGLASWSQTENLHYGYWSTHSWSLTPSTVRLSDLAGRYVSMCMQPNGNDTWKLNFLLQGKRSDGLKYEIRSDNVFLSRDVPCHSWDSTPDADPRGRIGVVGKCLSVANGGANVGTPIAVTSCTEGIDEEWILAPEVSAPSPEGARQGQIRHAAGKCLGLARGGTANGTPIQLQTCDGSLGQRWKWFGGGPSQITGPLTRCLDPNGEGTVVVSSAPATRSAPVIGDPLPRFLQYQDCTGASSQRWSLPSCGGLGQACCDSGLPCQGTLGCVNGTCAQEGSVEHLFVTLDTSNEDKDDNTKVVVSGLASWTGGGDTHYDDWSTHRAALNPLSRPLSSFPEGRISLHSRPEGDDSWKLNFIVDGVRDDGFHYEFRRDNVWLSKSDEDGDSRDIHWGLGPPPLDLVWTDTDANGLPLNPIWRAGEHGNEKPMDALRVCPAHSAPLLSRNFCLPPELCTGGTPNDYGQCSSQSPTFDRSWLCGWHANWFPVTFDGAAVSGSKQEPMPFGDDDFHVNLRPMDNASNLGRYQIIAEFDSDETVDQFESPFWKRHQDIDDLVRGNQARIIGLAGIDTEHEPPGGHGELHPVYVFTVRLRGGSTAVDTWAIFVRNWGNEGACGGSQHYLDLTQFTLRFPAPPFAEGATAVVERPDTAFHSASENGSDWSGATRTHPSPVQRDAAGTYVEMTFTIGPPETRSFVDGALFSPGCADQTSVTSRKGPARVRRARPRDLPSRKPMDFLARACSPPRRFVSSTASFPCRARTRSPARSRSFPSLRRRRGYSRWARERWPIAWCPTRPVWRTISKYRERSAGCSPRARSARASVRRCSRSSPKLHDPVVTPLESASVLSNWRRTKASFRGSEGSLAQPHPRAS